MRETFKIHVGFRSGEWSRAQALLTEHGFAELGANPLPPFGYHLPFATDAAAQAFLGAWRRAAFAGPEPVVRRQVTYAEEDIRAAALVVLVVRRPEKGHGGPRYGTEFDLSGACARCGTGAVQRGPLVVKPSELAKGGDVALTYDHEVLLSPRLADALRSRGLPADALRPVRGRKGEAVEWVQLLPIFELPPVAPETRGLVRERPCPVCRRDGFYVDAQAPLELVYPRAAVDPASFPGAALTWERFGTSRIDGPADGRGFASPLVVMTSSLADAFPELGVKAVERLPVQLR
jgi:hypothetical protein